VVLLCPQKHVALFSRGSVSFAGIFMFITIFLFSLDAVESRKTRPLMDSKAQPEVK
jgi:hypothetical protein